MNTEDLSVEPSELQRIRSQVCLVDVREPGEHARAHIPGDYLKPLGQLPELTHDLPRDQEIIVYCAHGVRSLRAASLLRQHGFQARSLEGGISRWVHQGGSVRTPADAS